jgi:hypothetical protein
MIENEKEFQSSEINQMNQSNNFEEDKIDRE